MREKISIPVEFDICECGSCGCKFILIAVIENDENGLDWTPQFLDKDGPYPNKGNEGYCPYCGKPIPLQ